jgi:hypothetical protein
LKQQGVDSIITYNSKYAPRYFFPSLGFNDYEFNDFTSSFTFWRKNGKSYFYYKSRGMYYPVHEFVADSIWNFYTANRAAIDSETFKIPLLKRVNIETEKITLSGPQFKEPGELRRLELNINDTKTIKAFDYEEFRQFGFSGEENLNYIYNINTKTAQFQRLIEMAFLRELRNEKAVRKPR